MDRYGVGHNAGMDQYAGVDEYAGVDQHARVDEHAGVDLELPGLFDVAGFQRLLGGSQLLPQPGLGLGRRLAPRMGWWLAALVKGPFRDRTDVT